MAMAMRGYVLHLHTEVLLFLRFSFLYSILESVVWQRDQNIY
jgi:hypothetical protein